MLKLCKNTLHGRDKGDPGARCHLPATRWPTGLPEATTQQRKGEEAWNNPSRLQGSRVDAAFFGCGASQCLSWLESHLRDAGTPLGRASQGLRQGPIPSRGLQTQRRLESLLL